MKQIILESVPVLKYKKDCYDQFIKFLLMLKLCDVDNYKKMYFTIHPSTEEDRVIYRVYYGRKENFIDLSSSILNECNKYR